MKIIGNPPYGKLFLKVLDKAMEHQPDAEIVWLAPIRWLEDSLCEYKRNTDFFKYEHIRKRIESLDVLYAREMAKLFEATFAMNLGVYHITKNGGGVDLRNKITMKMLTKRAFYTSFDVNKKDGWRVRVVVIHGGGRFGNEKLKSLKVSNLQKLQAYYDGMKDGRPWHEFYGKNKHSKYTEMIPYSIKFASEKEAHNFIDTMHTKVGRYYYGTLNHNMNVRPEYFLKLDWTQKWDDAALCKYFELTDEEFATIERELEELNYSE